MGLIASIKREIRHPEWPTAGEWLQVLGLVLLLAAPDLVMSL